MRRSSFRRKTALKVKHGRTAPKNRHVPTSHQGYVIDRESPGRGFRHVITKRDLQAFIDLIPDWGTWSHRLERIILAAGNLDDDGCYAFYDREETGSITLHAWEEDLWVPLSADYFSEHQPILEQLGVSWNAEGEDVVCRFTEAQAKAFVLLHVFLHELGHHAERLCQGLRDNTCGESYAEEFANRRFEMMFPDYVRVFGDPRLA
ncbi:MAG: hypothetical protein EOP84_27070 [Verrucomicrobiaceae bacterium]|nr:MAG: hypothetical protein EOP84_27070 [Verrucomicrobiaceae bacterium]